MLKGGRNEEKILAVLLTLFPFCVRATAQADTVKIVSDTAHHLNLKSLIRLTRGLTLISSTRSQKSKAGTLTWASQASMQLSMRSKPARRMPLWLVWPRQASAKSLYHVWYLLWHLRSLSRRPRQTPSANMNSWKGKKVGVKTGTAA